MTYWVVGVGAIGSVVAGKLAEHVDLVLVDAWREHVEAMVSRGLRVDYPEGSAQAHLPAFHLSDVGRIGSKPQVVLLAVKSYQTLQTVRHIEPYLSETSAVVSLQNSINEETIASVVGAERTIGAVVRLDGNLRGPGHASSMHQQRKLTIGELDGSMTDRLQAIARTLSAGIPTHMTGNILGELWTKMVRNCEVNGLAAVTGLDTSLITADPILCRVALGLGMEAVRVALELGMVMNAVELFGPPEAYLEPPGSPAMAKIEQGFKAAFANPFRPSTLQDVDKARPTEIDYINGYVVTKGREVGVPTPLNAALVRLVNEVEAGHRARGAEIVRRALDDLLIGC